MRLDTEVSRKTRPAGRHLLSFILLLEGVYFLLFSFAGRAVENGSAPRGGGVITK
jgi:hypothetical protein